MTDVGLFSADTGIDIKIEHGDVVLDNTLKTAVITSLFTDANYNGERGYWADATGSKLWATSGKLTEATRLKVIQYAREALQWMIDDGTATDIDITAERTNSGYNLIINIFISAGAKEKYNFEVN